MRVELARLIEQRARLGVRTSTSERGERPGVGEPGGVPVAGVGGEQLLELVVGLECQQPVRLSVAQPLVIAGVQPQQLALMLDCVLAPPQTPQRRGERGAGAHVRPRLEDQPEITGVLDKHAPPHRALAGGDTALKQLAHLLKA